jgi:hypothetical protein
MSENGKAQTSAAERMRRYRKCRLRGRRCVGISIGAAEIAALAEKGYLDPAEREDIGALEFVVSAFLSERYSAFDRALSLSLHVTPRG